ncbi:hypothetical protein [Halorussus salinus]|uniref:hypothetical protein n=1 Tax=Halorussus salinus TaxID=1364935 RepID=UPI0010932591|nr:hypothetical protein [Halorussus salinus]
MPEASHRERISLRLSVASNRSEMERAGDTDHRYTPGDTDHRHTLGARWRGLRVAAPVRARDE